MNLLKTAFLLALLTAIFILLGGLIAGQAGMIVALILAAGMNVFSFWNADRMVLRMQGARPVAESQAPELHRMVADLAGRAGLPKPAVYVIDTDQPNAFATGRSPRRSAVAVTRGLMRSLDRQELAGVIAHELAHIRNRDTLIMTVAAALAGALSLLANFALFLPFAHDEENPLGLVGVILTAMLAPLAAALVKMAISRTREFSADRAGAEICGDPAWLASALDKLERGASRIDNAAAERVPASAHLYIANPLHVHRVDRLFASHPPMAKRIERLMAMTAQGAHQGASARPAAGHGGPWG